MWGRARKQRATGSLESAAPGRAPTGSFSIGVIWRSPLGPLRFDGALPIDGERRELVFLFSLGGAP